MQFISEIFYEKNIGYIFFFCFISVFLSCSLSIDDNNEDEIPGTVNNLISDIDPGVSTKMLTAQEAVSSLISYNSANGHLVYSITTTSDAIKNLQVGDIIAIPVSTDFPDGFLRTITSRKENDTRLEFTTESTTMDDAFSAFSFSLTRGFTESEIKEAKLADGLKLVSIEQVDSSKYIQGKSSSDDSSLLSATYSLDMSYTNDDDQTEYNIKGTLKITPIIVINFDSTEKQLYYTIQTNTVLNITISVGSEILSRNDRVPLNLLMVKLFEFDNDISDFGKLEFYCYLHVSGSASIDMSGGATISTKDTFGVNIDQKNEISELIYNNDSYSVNPISPDYCFEGEATIAISGTVTLDLYGLKSPPIEGDIYVRLHGNRSMPLELTTIKDKASLWIEWGEAVTAVGSYDFWSDDYSTNLMKEINYGTIWSTDTTSDLIACKDPTIFSSLNDSGSEAEITLSLATPNATIWYTLDGSDPNPDADNGYEYSKPFIIDSSTSISACAFRKGNSPSLITTENINVDVEPIGTWALYIFDDAGNKGGIGSCNLNKNQTVTIIDESLIDAMGAIPLSWTWLTDGNNITMVAVLYEPPHLSYQVIKFNGTYSIDTISGIFTNVTFNFSGYWGASRVNESSSSKIKSLHESPSSMKIFQCLVVKNNCRF